MKNFLKKGYKILFYIILAGLFLKGEVFRIHTSWFSFTFSSVKNLTLLFILWWIILRVIEFKKPRLSPGLILTFLIGLISIIFSDFPASSMQAGRVLLIYIGWCYSMWFILGEPKYRMQLSLLMIGLASIVAILDLWFHWSVGISEIIEEYPFWKGKNALGLFLVMSLCFCLSWIVNVKKGRLLLLLIASFFILIMCIVLNFSRGAWIAGIVPIIGILFVRFRRALWIIAGFIFILLVISPPLVTKRFSSIFDVNEINIKNRINLWGDTIEIIKEKPFLGTGLGTFTESYKMHYLESVPIAGDKLLIIRHAHNLYLQTLMETGITGLAVFLWLIIIGLIQGIKNFINEKDLYLRSVRYGSLLGIVSFLIYSITDCTVSWQFIGDSFSHINLIWLVMWICLLQPVGHNSPRCNIGTVAYLNSMNQNTILQIQDLHTHFSVDHTELPAVNGVSLSIEKGKVLALVGESGCGKTMTALSILRLVPPPGRIVSGKILFNGKNLLELTESRMQKIRGKEISLIFQEPGLALNPVYTIGNQIGEVIKIHRKDIKNIRKEIIRLLELVKIPEPEHRLRAYPHQLSGGMQQRALIAMAIAGHPKLLIADEPTTALDVTIQAQILKLIKELVSKLDMSVFLITHDLGIVAEIANTVAIMYAGRIVEYTDVHTIFKNPLHPYTKGLLESIPKMEKAQKRLPAIPGQVPDIANLPTGCAFHPRCSLAAAQCRTKIPQLREITTDHLASCDII